jgi:tRNA pseudouridine55 synthase
MAPSEASGGAEGAHPPAMDGILVLAKPPGPTSHDMVALVRRLTATRRVGHGGTLDPFASGVLPIFLGRATRVVEYHLADRKRYRATVCIGATSSTDDLEGTIKAVAAPAPDRSAVEAALGAFLGVIEQRPPDYSAVKIAGRRAYAMARAGERPELRPRSVTIHAIELVEWDGTDSDRPVAVIEVECSAGTYIRAFARDLGVAVGSGAYLGALTRSASGPFRLDEAVSVDALRAAAAAGPDRIRALLLRAETGLERFPRMILDPPEVAAIARGQFVRPGRPVPAIEPDGHLRLVDAHNRLVAIAAWRDGRLAPEKVLVDVPARAGDD